MDIKKLLEGAGREVGNLETALRTADYDVSEVSTHQLSRTKTALEELIAGAQNGPVDEEVWNNKKGTVVQTLQKWEQNPSLKNALVALQNDFYGIWKKAQEVLQKDDPKKVKKTSESELRKR
jgi:hypothetical protein